MDHSVAAGRFRTTPIALVALAVLTVCGAAPLRGAQVVVDRVIAVVSGTVILQSDAQAALALGLVDAAGARDPVETAMRWLIDRQLVLDEAGRGDRLDVGPEAVARAVAEARQRFASDAEYRRTLAGLGLDDRGLERLLRDTLVARLYVERRFDAAPPLSEDELRAYYAANQARFVRNGRPVSFEDATAEVAAVLQRERRDQAVEAWMERLRRRADIREVWVQADRR
jgi:parvulin-like peptidyl-prolyl isomerase